MVLTARKKRPLNRTTHPLRDTQLFIIATEGECTEKQYFGMFRNTRIQVVVLNSVDGKSSPRHVLERLSEFKKGYDLNADDQLWLMIDRDRWPTGILNEVSKQLKQKKFYMAVSNPCFELWLFLHHADVKNDDSFSSGELEKRLKEILGGYNKSNLKTEQFKATVDEAIKRAKELDTDEDQRWPLSIGTHVYKVVEEIRKKQ